MTKRKKGQGSSRHAELQQKLASVYGAVVPGGADKRRSLQTLLRKQILDFKELMPEKWLVPDTWIAVEVPEWRGTPIPWWIVCFEVDITSRVNADKLARYAELWWSLDSLDVAPFSLISVGSRGDMHELDVSGACYAEMKDAADGTQSDSLSRLVTHAKRLGKVGARIKLRSQYPGTGPMILDGRRHQWTGPIEEPAQLSLGVA